MKAYYFGCVSQAGHFFHDTTLRRAGLRTSEIGLPWEQFDGQLPPQVGGQIEGQARLHHKDGWTALAFWDRSIDTRGNSNSAFVFDAILDFDQALEIARRLFPSIFERFEFEVVRWESPQERAARVAREVLEQKAYVVFSYGDPMPITSCRTPELAEAYAAALARLPEGHPLRTEDAIVDELPLLSELPAPLRDPENQPVPL